MLTGDKENRAGFDVHVHTVEVRPPDVNEGNICQGEHRHVCVQLLSEDRMAVKVTGYGSLIGTRNVTDGDIGSLLHQLIYRENKWRALSKQTQS